MKILVLNGNTTEAVTGRMLAVLRLRCPETVQLIGATAPFGMPYVGSRVAVAMAGHAALDAVRAAVAHEKEHGAEPFDACHYACFGEPGIGALREDNSFPVVGMAEGSIATALQLGERFSIVTVGAAWPPMLRELMRATTLDGRCAGVSVVPGDALALATSREEGLRVVRQAVRDAIARDAPDVVIIGGAAITGYAEALQGEIAVPILDSLTVSFEQTLALARARAFI